MDQGEPTLETGAHAIGASLTRNLLVKRGSVIELDSPSSTGRRRRNRISVFKSGADPIEILRTGNHPEDLSLSFSIVSGPYFGRFSDPTEIVPDSVTGLETGETVEPTVAYPTLVYTSDSGDDSEDARTFPITDSPGAAGKAVLQVNPPAFDAPQPDPPATVVAERHPGQHLHRTPRRA